MTARFVISRINDRISPTNKAEPIADTIGGRSRLSIGNQRENGLPHVNPQRISPIIENTIPTTIIANPAPWPKQ